MTADPFDPQSELAFVRSFLAGNEAAIVRFEERIRCVPRFLSAMNGRRGRPLGDHDLADLAQDTIMIVLRKLDEFAAWGPLEGWIFRLCHLEFLNALRRRERHLRRTSELVDDLGATNGSPVGNHDDVHRALNQVGGVEAEAIRMKHFDGLTFKEIGDRLGMPANTAKTRYYRGMEKLRGVMRTDKRQEGQE